MLYQVQILHSNVAERSFKNRCRSLHLDIEIIPSSTQDILIQSDIVCTATSIEAGAGPLFGDFETNPALHINAIGSDFPGKIELPLNFLKKSFICPDFIEQAVIEGECQQLSIDEIGPDIVTLLQNSEKYSFVYKQ